ncbi:MAG: hypothetical protein PHD15_06510 [Clostridia bacterium]|nr:hypothetical protein [Clostridia bacterium]
MVHYFCGWFNVGAGLITWLPLLLITIISILKNEHDNIKFKIKDNIAILLITACIYGIIFTIFFLINAYGSYLIGGIQARYYFMILPLVLILIKNIIENKVKIEFNFNELRLYGIIGLIALMPAYMDVIYNHLV